MEALRVFCADIASAQAGKLGQAASDADGQELESESLSAHGV